ncbi:MAG: YceI family protein [Proteobacteria bacterium]|nr:YceI family protein [Pseudomonadota bacterium]
MALVFAVSSAACKKDDGMSAPDKGDHNKAEESKTDQAKKDTPAKAVEVPAQPDKAASGVPVLADTAGTYAIDNVHSSVIFRAKHFGVAYVYGSFNDVKGTIRIDADPAKSEVSVDIAAGRLYSGNKKRDDHLKGPDFLNVKQFPQITFKSKSVVQAGPGKYKVSGDITLHGVTKPASATFEHVGAGKHPMDPKVFMTGFHGTFTVKRSEFGMTHMLGGISDEIDLTVSLEATRK